MLTFEARTFLNSDAYLRGSLREGLSWDTYPPPQTLNPGITLTPKARSPGQARTDHRRRCCEDAGLRDLGSKVPHVFA